MPQDPGSLLCPALKPRECLPPAPRLRPHGGRPTGTNMANCRSRSSHNQARGSRQAQKEQGGQQALEDRDEATTGRKPGAEAQRPAQSWDRQGTPSADPDPWRPSPARRRDPRRRAGSRSSRSAGWGSAAQGARRGEGGAPTAGSAARDEPEARARPSPPSAAPAAALPAPSPGGGSRARLNTRRRPPPLAALTGRPPRSPVRPPYQRFRRPRDSVAAHRKSRLRGRGRARCTAGGASGGGRVAAAPSRPPSALPASARLSAEALGGPAALMRDRHPPCRVTGHGVGRSPSRGSEPGSGSAGRAGSRAV